MNKEYKVKRMLSGVKPTGRPHLGNYFGAMKQFVDMQGEYDESFVFIADYHALNTVQNREEMRENILNLIIDYLAIGLDSKKVVLYQQSRLPEHTELAWIFDTIVMMPYLERAHVYKDAKAKGIDINVGTFNYPILMAADILLYDADAVPVGKDQKQHLEFARDIAEKFNKIYGETFKLPKPIILEDMETVPGLDGRKMSKSYGNTIPLFASREEIEKAVKKIVTDSSGERPENVYAIHKLFKTEEELAPMYEANKGRYGDLKKILIEDIDAFIAPMRERRAEIAKDTDFVKEVLDNGANIAHELAAANIQFVRDRLGVII
jgi:tryptophanyl-tRNA synthetase